MTIIQFPDLNGWTALPASEQAQVLTTLQGLGWQQPLDPETTRISHRRLSFCEGAELLRLEDRTWYPGVVRGYAVVGTDGETWRLDGTCAPVYRLVREPGFLSTYDNAVDYLRFFCFFVRGENGPFLLLDSEETADYLPDRAAWRALQAETRGLTVLGDREEEILNELLGYERDTGVHVTAPLYYSGELFWARFFIRTNGLIEMIGDAYSTGLRSRINAPLA